MQLAWTGPAEADLYQIADRYAQFDRAIPLKILQHIYEAPRILLEQPRLGAPTKWVGIRKWPARETPFILLYAIRPGFIEVRRVVHNRSDWQSLQP